MALLASAINPDGLVVGIIKQSSIYQPVLCDECIAPHFAKKIPAFRKRILSEKERKDLIAHAQKCRPCSLTLGWIVP